MQQFINGRRKWQVPFYRKSAKAKLKSKKVSKRGIWCSLDHRVTNAKKVGYWYGPYHTKEPRRQVRPSAETNSVVSSYHLVVRWGITPQNRDLIRSKEEADSGPAWKWRVLEGWLAPQLVAFTQITSAIFRDTSVELFRWDIGRSNIPDEYVP